MSTPEASHDFLALRRERPLSVSTKHRSSMLLEPLSDSTIPRAGVIGSRDDGVGPTFLLWDALPQSSTKQLEGSAKIAAISNPLRPRSQINTHCSIANALLFERTYLVSRCTSTGDLSHK